MLSKKAFGGNKRNFPELLMRFEQPRRLKAYIAETLDPQGKSALG
jgi:hypothetical protein